MTPSHKVTIRDVAREAGVAISSVSRVLSGHPHVSDDLRARVDAAAKELGYRPNHIAYSLRRGSTASVGFLIGTIANPVMADISASVSDVLSSRGYATILVCSQNEPDADIDYLHFLIQRQVSGLIISSAAHGPDDQLRALISELALPAVMLDRDRPDSMQASTVLSDHAAGMKSAVLHLIEQGHRRIGLIGAPEYFVPARARLQGYFAALQEASLDIDPALVRSLRMSPTYGYEQAKSLLALADPPTALIAGGNVILTGILVALKEMGIAVGKDLALVGCDDTDLTRSYSPSITVIGRDLRLVGSTAAELLLQGMEGRGGQTITLPTQLIIRESSLVYAH